jgi:hypothetical protein
VGPDHQLELLDVDVVLAPRVRMQRACEAAIRRVDLAAGCARVHFELCVPVDLRLASGCHLVDLRG